MSVPRDRPVIMYETGPDESALIGTHEQLARFARTILDQLAQLGDESNHHGVDVRFLQVDPGLNDPLGDIAIDGIVVVANESDRRKLVNAILVNNGEPQIDWDDRDELHRTA